MIQNIKNKIKQASQYNKAKSDKHGEVFTPFELISEMLDQLPAEVWSDSSKTFFDPCSGKGNFPIMLVERLMEGLKHKIPGDYDRYKHIMEHQIYMSEYQHESCDFIRKVFNPNSDIKLNLYEGDTLQMSVLTQYDIIIGNPPYNDSNQSQKINGSNQGTANFYQYFINKLNDWTHNTSMFIYILPPGAWKYFDKAKIKYTCKFNDCNIFGKEIATKCYYSQNVNVKQDIQNKLFTKKISRKQKPYGFRPYNYISGCWNKPWYNTQQWTNQSQKIRWKYAYKYDVIESSQNLTNLQILLKYLEPVLRQWHYQQHSFIKILDYDWIEQFNRDIVEQDIKNHYGI